MMYIPLNIEPTDCESCGTSYDELTVEFVGDEWIGTLRIGCTGGAGYSGSRQGLIGWLKGAGEKIVDPDELAVAIEQLRKA